MILKYLSSTISAILMMATCSCYGVITTDQPIGPASFGSAAGSQTASVAIPTSAPTTASTTTAPTASQAGAAAPASSGKSITGNTSAVSKILHPEGEGSIKTVDSEVIIEPMTNADVREIIIDESSHNMKCACPYSVNDLGFECGLESAYYRPGGYRIKCYPQDIRGQEYIYFRKKH